MKFRPTALLLMLAAAASFASPARDGTRKSVRDSLLEKGDYRRVIEYDDSLTRKEEERRRNALRELELISAAEAKEAEYQLLKQNQKYSEERNRLFVVICILLLAGCTVFVLYISSRRTNMKRRTALINAEKEEAKLKLKLIEEQAVKLELQKYEILSEFNLKDEELSDRNKDYELLRMEKEQLDIRVEKYRQNIEALEAAANSALIGNSELQKDLIREMTPQIRKYIPEHEACLKSMTLFNDSFTSSVMNASTGGMSRQYLKYCLCFAAGMSIKEISDCCFVEQSSVHMIRYHLKKKFNLGNDGDIDLFLKKMSL